MQIKEENSLKIKFHNDKVIDYRKVEYQKNKDKFKNYYEKNKETYNQKRREKTKY